MKTITIFLLTIISALAKSHAQQTVGIFLNETDAFNGYTLFSPIGSNTTYLIDNCGNKVNTWESGNKPGMSGYLLEDGSLLIAVQKNGIINGSGKGGRIERYDWNGNLTWQFDYVGDTFHQHHDIEPLPNGNVLLISWDLISAAEVVENGRDISQFGESDLLFSKIVELEPTSNSGSNIVWEWRAWDHIVQDVDDTKLNYGNVGEHPELIDLNYFATDTPPPQSWLHFNSIDYNEAFDQILVSSRNFSEIWVIDHSTTTAEAASHSGGDSAKGGDILYRWGNPDAYGKGADGFRQLYFQHDARWVLPDTSVDWRVSVFNNGLNRPEGNFSSIEIIAPPVNGNGSYFIGPDGIFGPQAPDLTYQDEEGNMFYSHIMSGAQVLPNNNILICEATSGRLFELTKLGGKVWEYTSPVSGPNIVEQGAPVFSNTIFKVTKYGEDYKGLMGKDLTPGDPIELMPWDYGCSIFSGTTANIENGVGGKKGWWKMSPNPVQKGLLLETQVLSPPFEIIIYNMVGQIKLRQQILRQDFYVPVHQWENGVYVLSIKDKFSNNYSELFLKLE